MKIAKLSLATIMAVGAMGTISKVEAKPLEEAIKGVEFSGFARYRFNHYGRSNGGSWETSDKDTSDLDLNLKFEAPIDDNMKLVVNTLMAGDDKNTENSAGNGSGVGGDDENEFRMQEMYYMYTNGGFSTKLGRQFIVSPMTDGTYNGDRADGIYMTYNFDFPMTVNAAFFNTSNIVTNSGSSTHNIFDFVGSGKGMDNGADEADRGDIGLLGFSGSAGPVNLQLWGMHVEDILDSQIFTQIDTNFGNSPFKFTAQAISTTINDDTFGTNGARQGDVLEDDTGLFYATSLGFEYDWFRTKVGFLSNDEDQPVHSLTWDGDAAGIMSPGYRMSYGPNSDISMWGGEAYWIDLGFKMGKWDLYGGYAYFEQDGDVVFEAADKDEELTEMWATLAYKYSKNLTTLVRFSDMTAEENEANEREFWRFEMKYKF